MALIKPKIGGITISVSKVEEIMPPITGTAMHIMISDPVPLLHMIGSGPAVMATTVIILGRTRSTAPFLIASRRSARLKARHSLLRRALISASAWLR
jgi:hypothetical protein